MSYCRFGWDRSNVYVYASDEALHCCGCALKIPARDKWGDFNTRAFSEMIAHLEAHQAAGHNVPQYAFDRLRHEMKLFDDDMHKIDYNHPEFDAY
jgi:hypothetical protein